MTLRFRCYDRHRRPRNSCFELNSIRRVAGRNGSLPLCDVESMTAIKKERHQIYNASSYYMRNRNRRRVGRLRRCATADDERTGTTVISSGLFSRIYDIVRHVPRGRVSSYGLIARIAGCDARMVGYALASVPQSLDLPWQRIVNRKGEISLSGLAGSAQRVRLEAEGVAFDRYGRIDLRRFGWTGRVPRRNPKRPRRKTPRNLARQRSS
jgi:methylated-DNA-protein-cysteine methyltransferase-like protein